MRGEEFNRTIMAVMATVLIVGGIYGSGVLLDIIDFTGKATSSVGKINLTIADSTNPNVTIHAPTGTITTVNTLVNITVRDNGALSTCWFNVTNNDDGSLITNAFQTITCGVEQTQNINFTKNGNYTVFAFANDSSNNLNNTETLGFIVAIAAAPSPGASGGAGSSTSFGVAEETIIATVVVGETEIIGLEIINENTFTNFFIIDVEGPLREAIELISDGFTIKPGRRKRIEFEVIADKAGVYVGNFVVTSRAVFKKIPYIVTVQSKGISLRVVDLQVLALDNIIYRGEDANIEVFLDTGTDQIVDAAADYLLKDLEGNTLDIISEFITVKGTKVVHKKLSTSGLEAGQYVAEVRITNKNRVAVDAEFVYVSERAISQEEVGLPKYRVELILLLILGLILLYININRMKKHKKRKKKRH